VPHGTLQTLHVSAVFGVGEGRHVQGLRHHHRPFRVADPLTPQVLPLKSALRHPSPLPPITDLVLLQKLADLLLIVHGDVDFFQF
jgi:hypothetical protein